MKMVYNESFITGLTVSARCYCRGLNQWPQRASVFWSSEALWLVFILAANGILRLTVITGLVNKSRHNTFLRLLVRCKRALGRPGGFGGTDGQMSTRPQTCSRPPDRLLNKTSPSLMKLLSAVGSGIIACWGSEDGSSVSARLCS